MTIIVPAILATTEEEYKHKLDLIFSKAEFANSWVQIDFADNKFVQNKTVGIDIVSKYLTSLKIEAHLMVQFPDDWIDQLVKINVKRIIIPIEVMEGIQGKIDQIRQMGLEVGLSINPETPVEKLERFMSTIDAVLVMSIHPGFGGQEFMPESITKVAQIKSWGADVKIGVDGGVSPENARDLAVAGADYLVVGSHLLEGNMDENIQKFREAFKI